MWNRWFANAKGLRAYPNELETEMHHLPQGGQKWVTQIALDDVFNIVKEFWPDINHAVFHGKY
jgi:hypothetical protein